ncbi:phosphoglycolate phosphatase [Loktanella ponticola]|uniref:phosphoglycolate phosphatase n=1 Tax=Yoonia ponticola TaxID=1524255 RepID=A0A7W9BKP1_9RHOB|nr:HAD family hydrolase [Yoonia ponticola]MBB5722195.1 phosphoglycolate phosphatase [Yoonia ponticola]
MRTVVFDLDGTLADTSGDLLAAANSCFRGLGLDDLLTPADRGTALKGGRAMLRLGFSRVTGYGEDEVDRQYQALLDAYALAIDTHTVFYPGAMEAVRALKDDGYVVAICTNKPEALAHTLLTSLGVRDEFAALLGADSLPVRKPDPEHLFETVRRAGGHIDKSILIGDTVTDRDTSKNAGRPSILVTFGPGDDDVRDLKPEGLIGHFDELHGEVRRLIG